MKLITAEIKRKMPGPRAQEHVSDPIAYLKLFHPASNWTWYITEAWQEITTADGQERDEPLKYTPQPGETVDRTILFGKVVGFETEIGPVTLEELENSHKGQRGMAGLPIERDRFFDPKPVSQCN